MSPAPNLCWIIQPTDHRREIEYTCRLLSTLLGRHAIIVPAPQTPTDPDSPTIWYGDQLGPSGDSISHIHPDRAFWDAIDGRRDVLPTGSVTIRNTVFPRWDSEPIPVSGYGQTTGASLSADPIASTFYLVSRVEEVRSRRVDRHGRFPAAESWMVQAGLIERPLVHAYADLIAALLGLPHGGLASQKVWPDDKRFAIAFTHDIDRMRMHGPLWQDLRRALGGLRFPGGLAAARRRWRSRRKVLSGKTSDPYDTIDRLVEGHVARDFRATFFWINAKPTVQDADYTCKDPNVRALMSSLRDQGFEHGLHGSYKTFDVPSMLIEQRESLEKATRTPVTSTRQHYLRFQAFGTWKAQIAAGLTIDSTLGFAERFGFRAGLAVPFHPWDFESRCPLASWEVPLVMMDGTAREYMGLTPGDAVVRSKAIIAQIARTGGAGALLWHNSSLDGVDWYGWDRVYETWLNETRDSGGLGAAVSTIVEAWASFQRRLGNEENRQTS